MAQGFVHAGRSPRVFVEIFGHSIDAIVDTGFEGGLQLPDPLIQLLPVGTLPIRRNKFGFSFGRTSWLDVDPMTIQIDGIDVEVIFSPVREALIGVDILKDYSLTIDFPAGTVQLT